MTDITTPAQMREAVEQAVLAEKMRMMSWCAKRQAVSRKAWERAARKALAGDMADLRNRIALIDAGPLDIVQSDAGDDALPVADPLCTWPSCGHTAKGQCRTYTSGQLIAPNDASIAATNMPVAEPEPVAVNAVMCAAERDAQSRDAVDLTLFRQAIRAEALEEAAAKATSFLVGDPHNGVPLRNPMAHEIAAAIRALIEKSE